MLVLRVPPRLVQVRRESRVTGTDGDHVQGEAQAELAVSLDLVLDPEVYQTRISVTSVRHEQRMDRLIGGVAGCEGRQ